MRAILFLKMESIFTRESLPHPRF